MLAYELKRPLSEILALKPEEFIEWMAFFMVKSEYEEEASKKRRAKGSRGRR